MGRRGEDARGAVLVGVLGVGARGAVSLELGEELGVLGLEGVADVLEEDQAQDDVLVLRGVHVVAQGVGGLPELRLEAAVGGGRGRARGRAAPRARGPGHGFPAVRCHAPQRTAWWWRTRLVRAFARPHDGPPRTLGR